MKKMVGLVAVSLIGLLLAGCSSSTSAEKAAVPEVAAEPSVQFVNALQANFDSRLELWSTASDVNDQALAKFISSIEVSTDESFEIVTVTVNAEIGGEDADLGMGSLVGTQIDVVNGLTAAVYCAGKTYPNGDDTFNNFVKTMVVDFDLNDDLTGLAFPSKGIIVKMIWNKSTVKTDEYGSDTKTLSLIGTDQVGISTANFQKISDVYSADYRKLSDIAPVSFSKKSWYNGLCAAGQSANN
jgi:outer membrane murein-binding lipoprotein Lpp